MLTLRHFFPSNEKVRQLDLHPVQPWLATGSKSDVVTVLDWSTRQVLQQFQLGAMGEEDMCGDADLARLHAKDPQHSVNPSVVANSTSRSATGKVRDVRFFDKDVAQAHLTTQHLHSTGPCRPTPNIQDVFKMGASRMLVAVCDLKVLLYELGSKRVQEVPKAFLEGKSPFCCAFLLLGGKAAAKDRSSPLLPSPVLALGCSDGIVRLFSLSNLRPVGRLVGQHKSPVVAMTVMGMRGGVEESLLVAHEGGNVQRFAPSDVLFKSMAPKGEARDLGPVRVSPKAHKDTIQSMTVLSTAENPETSPGRLVVTCGADRNLIGFGPSTMQEVMRIKMPSKESCVAFCPRGITTSGAHTLLLGTDVGALMCVHLESGSIRLAVDLNDIPTLPGVPSSKKPQSSINSIAVHALQPHIVAIAATTGTYLLQCKEAAPPLPYVALPLLSPAQALASPTGGIEGANMTYVVAVGGEVHCVTVAATEHELPLPAELEAAAPNPPLPPTSTPHPQLRLQQQQPQQQEHSLDQDGVMNVPSPPIQPPKKKGLVAGLLGFGDKASKKKEKEEKERAAAGSNEGASKSSSPSILERMTSAGHGKKEEDKEGGGSKVSASPPPPEVSSDRKPASDSIGMAIRLQQRQQQQLQQQQARANQMREQRQRQQEKEYEEWRKANKEQPGSDKAAAVPGQPSTLGVPGVAPGMQDMMSTLATEHLSGKLGEGLNLTGLPGSPAVELLSCQIMDVNRPASRALLGCSTDGSYVSVVWPAARQYSIYHQGTTHWESVASGTGVDVAWGWNEHFFAVVEAATPPPSQAPVGSGKPSSKKAAAKEAEMKRANELAAEAAALVRPNSVQIMKIKGRSVSGLAHLSIQGGDAPTRVFSGPLLGITTKKQLTEVNLGGVVDAEAPLSFRLHTWTSNSQQVGQEMPEPLAIAWDPTGILVALAYPSQVLLCSVSPTLSVLASLPIQNTVGLQWAMRQLFVLTQTHAYAVCVALPGTGPAFQGQLPVVQLVLEVAALGLQAESTSQPPSLTLGETGLGDEQQGEMELMWGGPKGGLGLNEGPLPPTLPRPPGVLALLGPRGGVLWVGNTNVQALAVPISQHPVLRAISIAASGNVQGAILYAKNSLHPSHHGILATFLANGGGDGDKPKGANAALALPGLTLLEEAVLRVQLRHWPMAVEAIEALLAGFRQRPPADGTFRFPCTTAAFGSWSGASDAARANGGVPIKASTSAALSSQPYEDDLDWMLPLRQAGTSTSARTAVRVAASPAPRSQAPPPQTVAAASLGVVADLALDLLRGLVSVGMHDAAQPVARLMLGQASQLSPRQLSALCTCMAEVDMRKDLPLLLACSFVPGADAMSRESVGLLAAVMSGHTSLVNEVLRQTGAPALAAAQANWSRDEYNNETTVAQAGTEWVAQLMVQAHNMAPPTTPLYAVPHLAVGKSSRA